MSDYQYNLVMTKNGFVSIDKIQEGTEVMCLGEWKKAPKPVKGTCLRCEFDTLPTTTFEKSQATHKHEASIIHKVNFRPNGEDRPELSIIGYFKENRSGTYTTFAGYEDIGYWTSRFIRFYGRPVMPQLCSIGFTLDFDNKKCNKLSDEEITERNLEYVLEGFLKKSFSYNNHKYLVTHPRQFWNETIRLTLCLLDIECDVFVLTAAVKNPISLYRHIRDDYNKSKLKDEDIVYNLKRSKELPLYTNGVLFKKKTEVVDWMLPGINPDINGINPKNCFEKGFTSKKKIWCDETLTDGTPSPFYKKDNFFELLTNPQNTL